MEVADHYLELFCRQYGKQVVMPDELRETYCSHSWPGHVRELKREIHGLVLLTPSDRIVASIDSQVASEATWTRLPIPPVAA